METLESKLGYRFKDRSLLENALTHSSYANEAHSPMGSNERLEFLGDSILGMVTADYLFQKHPDEPEGDLTRIRASLVCEESLVEVAEVLGLGAYLKLGKGEETGGGRERPSIRADARKIVQRFILDKETEKSESRDYKTALQELVQRTPGKTISYRLVEETGPDHCRSFVMEVWVDGRSQGRGQGRSKKEAEQMAAKAAIARLK